MINNSLSYWVVLYATFVVSLCLFFPEPATALHGVGEAEQGGSVPLPVPAKHGTAVKKDQRKSVVTEESGEISEVKVSDGRDGFYHLQFITMEPNSLFLPVHLHSDMVFYVNSGSGTLSWVDLEKDNHKLQKIQLQTGDVYRLQTGSFFYIESDLETERRKLRIYAIFSDSKEELREGSLFGAYASVRDLVLGFDNKVLQAALSVDEKVIQELKGSGERQPMIVHGVSKANELWEVHYKIMRSFLGRMSDGLFDVNKKDKKGAYNILTAKHDVENQNGWSLVVTSKQLQALKGSDFGIFLVNLTQEAMMGPHWNPTTVEIAIVLQGRGMVHVVCPSATNETECKNKRFRVEEGDVFVVPRYHPMAQISFNNESFVFVGFTTTTKKNHPQYLVGKASVLQTLDKKVVATSLGVSNTTMDELLSAQKDAIIVKCTWCAEEEERLMEEEIAKKEEEREEEERRREEEEAKREEEEEKRREEEEKRKEEEEAAKRREEEEKRKQEEEAARQREEEEAARREAEEAARKREEEEAAKEEETKRREEEAEAARKQEEEAARRQEEEEEAARRQEEAARKREEEEAARREEQQEAEAARKREEEEAARQREEEEVKRQEEAEAARQREEAAKRREEEAAARRQREETKEEEERRRQEEEEASRQREEARKEQEEESRRQQEEAARRQRQEEEAGHGREGEAASRQEEEMARRQREAEAAARGGGGRAKA